MCTLAGACLKVWPEDRGLWSVASWGASWRLTGRVWAAGLRSRVSGRQDPLNEQEAGVAPTGRVGGRQGCNPLSTGPMDVPSVGQPGSLRLHVHSSRGTRMPSVCVRAHVCQGGSCWGSDLSLSARTAGWGEGLLPEHLCVSPDFHAHLRAT